MSSDIRKSNPFVLILMYAIVIVFAILAIYPILWLIMMSFKTTQEYMLTSKLALPQTWFAGNYPWAWTMGKFGTLTINSIIYTSVTIISIIILSFMAGFAFAKLPSKWTPLLHGSFIIGILLVLQSIMVPLFLLINSVGL
jgi:raffinose/stachyose/melibiose transport system permease protein